MSINGNAARRLNGAAKKDDRAGGSDLHLRVDSPPQVRIHGKLRPLDGYAVLGPEDARQLAITFLTPDQKQTFDARRELDLSIGLEGISRFRVNIFQQKETVGGVFRAIPYQIKSFEDLGLPPIVADLCRRPADYPCHRPDRLRQINDARDDDRPDQRPAS